MGASIELAMLTEQQVVKEHDEALEFADSAFGRLATLALGVKQKRTAGMDFRESKFP